MQTLSVSVPAWIFIGGALVSIVIALLYLLRGRRYDSKYYVFTACLFSASAIWASLIDLFPQMRATSSVSSGSPVLESSMDWEYFSRGEITVQTFHPPVPGTLVNRIIGEVAPGIELGIVYKDRVEGYSLVLIPTGRTNGPISVRSFYVTKGTNGLHAIDVADILPPRAGSF